jgi:hypothetical protein
MDTKPVITQLTANSPAGALARRCYQYHVQHHVQHVHTAVHAAGMAKGASHVDT